MPEVQTTQKKKSTILLSVEMKCLVTASREIQFNLWTEKNILASRDTKKSV